MLEVNFCQIGQRIKAKRKELGMTQLELATRVGLSPASISKYENGKVEDATTVMFNNFANVLGVSPAYLMGWVENPNDTLSDPGDVIFVNNKIIKYDDLSPEDQQALEQFYIFLKSKNKGGE